MSESKTIRVRKRYGVPVILAGFAVLFLLAFLFLKGLIYIPKFGQTNLVHPSGYSIRVGKNIYACTTETGFSVGYFVPLTNVLSCSGPTPKPYNPEDVQRVRRYPKAGAFDILIGMEAFVPPQESSCSVKYAKRSRRRGLRQMTYYICSDGGGSGGMEYSASGAFAYDGKVFSADDHAQDEWGPPSFNYMWDAILTVEKVD